MKSNEVKPHLLTGMLVRMLSADKLKSLTWSTEAANPGHIYTDSAANYLANKYAMISEVSSNDQYLLYFPDDNYIRGSYPADAFELVTDLLTEYRR